MHTQETKDRIRKAILEKYKDKEYVNKRNSALRIAMQQQELREKISIRMKGNKNPAKRINVRNKISNTIKKLYYTDKTYKKRVSEGTKFGMHKQESWNKYLKSRKFIKYKTSDTSIEKKIEKELINKNIKYEKQKLLLNTTYSDFYLPDYNIVIYCDGDYWHGNKKYFKKFDSIQLNNIKKDERHNKILKDNDFIVYRFWEHEINKSPISCINRIFNNIVV